ncbi:MAG: hypothetical protein WCE44_02500 [Candidatus Velthaea sp.]
MPKPEIVRMLKASGSLRPEARREIAHQARRAALAGFCLLVLALLVLALLP